LAFAGQAQAATCTAAQQSARAAALAAYRAQMTKARAAYFRTHASASARAAFVAAQKRKLAQLTASASCTVPPPPAPTFTVVPGPDVAQSDIDQVNAAVAKAPSYFGRFGVDPFGTKIHVYSSRETLEPAYMAATGATQDQADQLWASSTAAGDAGNGIWVNTGQDFWQRSPPGVREAMLSHEIFHVAQSLLEGLSKWNTAYDARGAVWLLEGSAEYFGYNAMIDAGALSADAVEGEEQSEAANANGSLSTYAGYDAYTKPSLYSLGYLAVEKLVQLHGAKAVIDYWRDLATTATWQDAFAKAFGEPVDQFYAEFGR
jgi:hypothetical protein